VIGRLSGDAKKKLKEILSYFKGLGAHVEDILDEVTEENMLRFRESRLSLKSLSDFTMQINNRLCSILIPFLSNDKNNPIGEDLDDYDKKIARYLANLSRVTVGYAILKTSTDIKIEGPDYRDIKHFLAEWYGIN